MSGIVTTDYLRCFGGVRWSDAIDSVVILSITVIILFFALTCGNGSIRHRRKQIYQLPMMRMPSIWSQWIVWGVAGAMDC